MLTDQQLKRLTPLLSKVSIFTPTRRIWNAVCIVIQLAGELVSRGPGGRPIPVWLSGDPAARRSSGGGWEPGFVALEAEALGLDEAHPEIKDYSIDIDHGWDRLAGTVGRLSFSSRQIGGARSKSAKDWALEIRRVLNEKPPLMDSNDLTDLHDALDILAGPVAREVQRDALADIINQLNTLIS